MDHRRVDGWEALAQRVLMPHCSLTITLPGLPDKRLGRLQ